MVSTAKDTSLNARDRHLGIEYNGVDFSVLDAHIVLFVFASLFVYIVYLNVAVLRVTQIIKLQSVEAPCQVFRKLNIVCEGGVGRVFGKTFS